MIVAACSSTTVSTGVENYQEDSAFGNLSEEMMLIILSYLDRLSDRYHIALTCKKMYRITSDSVLWREQIHVCGQLFSRKFPNQQLPVCPGQSLDSWKKMSVYRKRYSQLFADTCSVRELAEMKRKDDVYSMQEYSVQLAWNNWLKEKKGVLTIPVHIKFKKYTFQLFLKSLALNKQIKGLDFQCSISKGMIEELERFFSTEGHRFDALILNPRERLNAFHATCLLHALRFLSHLTSLEINRVDFKGDSLHRLNTAVDGMHDLQSLQLGCEFQKLGKEEWEWIGRLYLNRCIQHIWIKGMDDYGIHFVASSLLVTSIPHICFRSGNMTFHVSRVFEHLLLQNKSIKLLDLACNVNIDYDQVPDLIKIVKNRPEISFGISGSSIVDCFKPIGRKKD